MLQGIFVYGCGQLGALAVLSYAVASESPSTLITSTAFIVGGLAMVLSLLLLMKLRGIDKSVLKLNRVRFGDVGYALVGFMAYLVLSLIAANLLKLLVPSLDLNQAQEFGLKDVRMGMLALVFVALAVIPPISEELIFRGFLYGRFVGHGLSKWMSAILVSVLFGVVHGQWNVAIDTFVLSIVMIYLLERRQSLWVAIFLHAIKNTVAFLAIFVFKVA
jgi:membrane protease YdiL (CAAX protease family)